MVQVNNVKAVLIGGGIICVSVLYHMAKLGWDSNAWC
jgi:glycine/D-amino acid oxidase-like deaminating enzyme